MVVELRPVGFGDVAEELEGGGAALDGKHIGAEIDNGGGRKTKACVWLIRRKHAHTMYLRDSVNFRPKSTA
jgi:hypothetical protein